LGAVPKALILDVPQIVAILVPTKPDRADKVGWNGTNIRHFIVESAYDLEQGITNI